MLARDDDESLQICGVDDMFGAYIAGTGTASLHSPVFRLTIKQHSLPAGHAPQRSTKSAIDISETRKMTTLLFSWASRIRSPGCLWDEDIRLVRMHPSLDLQRFGHPTKPEQGSSQAMQLLDENCTMYSTLNIAMPACYSRPL